VRPFELLDRAFLPSRAVPRFTRFVAEVVTCLQKADERINGGKLKEVEKFNINRKFRPQLLVDLDHAERVPANIKKVVIHPHLIDAESGLPRSRNGFFQFGPRQYKFAGQLLLAQNSQSGAVNLTPGIFGQLLQGNKSGWNHVRRQLVIEVAAHFVLP